MIKGMIRFLSTISSIGMVWATVIVVCVMGRLEVPFLVLFARLRHHRIAAICGYKERGGLFCERWRWRYSTAFQPTHEKSSCDDKDHNTQLVDAVCVWHNLMQWETHGPSVLKKEDIRDYHLVIELCSDDSLFSGRRRIQFFVEWYIQPYCKYYKPMTLDGHHYIGQHKLLNPFNYSTHYMWVRYHLLSEHKKGLHLFVCLQQTRIMMMVTDTPIPLLYAGEELAWKGGSEEGQRKKFGGGRIPKKHHCIVWMHFIDYSSWQHCTHQYSVHFFGVEKTTSCVVQTIYTT